MSRWLKGLIAGAATGLIGAGFALTPLGVDFEKHVGLACLFKIRGAIEPPPEAVVVAINERDTRGLGLPELPRDWPRSTHARLIEQLVEGGASVIVFDMDFERPKNAEHDLEFARAAAASRRVVVFEKLSGKRQPLVDASGKQSGSIWAEELIPPIPALAQAARGLGPFPVPKVQVNVFQFWAFKPSLADAPTLPAVALQVHALGVYPRWLEVLEQAGAPGLAELPREPGGLADAAQLRAMMRALRRIFKNGPALEARIGDALGVGSGAQMQPAEQQLIKALNRLYAGDDNRYLNFYGPPGSIRTIPYNAVITGSAPGIGQAGLDFNGKVVFVGFSDLFDPGQPDRFYTVFTNDEGVDLSGVEIAATAFANLLTDRTLRPADAPMTAVILMLIGLILGTGVYLLAALAGVPLALLLTSLYVAVAQFVFNSADVWLPLATPVIVQLPMALFIGLIGHYLLERHRQQRVSKAVGYYLPDHIAKELTEKELDPSALNRVAEGICLATDMSGFTSIAEKMAPDELAVFMNTYFDALAEALKRHQVDITEFHADTVMCAWIAEKSNHSIGYSAALASLAVVDAVDRFNKTTGAGLYARVGFADGTFFLGHTGGGGRFGYSILGDCANTAARIESLNRHLGSHILATQSAVANVDGLLIRQLGRFALVGRSEPISLVEILAAAETAQEGAIRLSKRFGEALDSFHQQSWQDAAERFEVLVKDFSEDGPARFYLARCRDYLSEAPLSMKDPTVIQMETK